MTIRCSVCICTRNRPEELAKALLSIRSSDPPAHEVIVADDSTDTRTRVLLATRFPETKYVRGPKRGLSANRNTALGAVTGTHVLFMDDDVVMEPHFLSHIEETFRENEKHGDKCMVTGFEQKNGATIYPHEQTFLGYQSKPYKDGEPLKTIVINSTVFPASLFQRLRFDEKLIYGYDEVDLATRAEQLGYAIVLAKEAFNYHFPSDINRDYYKPHVESSRLYATFKRYFRTERKYMKAIAFAIIGFFHMTQHDMRRAGPRGLILSLGTVMCCMKLDRKRDC
jgi:GT2 family glycosyltransferase